LFLKYINFFHSIQTNFSSSDILITNNDRFDLISHLVYEVCMFIIHFFIQQIIIFLLILLEIELVFMNYFDFENYF